MVIETDYDEGESISYRMLNEVNGEEVQIKGDGRLRSSGQMTLEAEISHLPKDWNPIVVPLICSGPGPGPGPDATGLGAPSSTGGLISFSPRGYRTSPGTMRVASLFDERGRQLASVRATGVYRRDESGLDFDIRVQTRTAKGSILPELESVDHYSFTIHPNGPGQVVVFAHYSLSARGRKVHGWTHIHYDLLGTVQALAQPIVGSNRVHVDISGTRLRYDSLQRLHAASELGQAWV